jgi:hypothetical protein
MILTDWFKTRMFRPMMYETVGSSIIPGVWV